MRPLGFAWLFALGIACGPPTRGHQQMGERCRDDLECARGLCVSGVHGDAPVCTVSCASDAECPPRWTCHGVTQRQVLVCAHGGSTPLDPSGEH